MIIERAHIASHRILLSLQGLSPAVDIDEGRRGRGQRRWLPLTRAGYVPRTRVHGADRADVPRALFSPWCLLFRSATHSSSSRTGRPALHDSQSFVVDHCCTAELMPAAVATAEARLPVPVAVHPLLVARRVMHFVGARRTSYYDEMYDDDEASFLPCVLPSASSLSD